MCLILFSYNTHPIYKLIVAANRDEFYERPTAPAHYWNDNPMILAGRDLLQMGTWMGVSTTGRFAALTNFRDPTENTVGKRSRGELVSTFLNTSLSVNQYMEKIALERSNYPGFNYIAYDNNELFYYSNIENKIKQLKSGIYGVSNHLLDTEWPKVTRGKEGLARISNQPIDSMVEDLFLLLQNTDPVPDQLLPSTGVSLEWERRLSPLFIRSGEGYGTRCSTVLLMTDKEIDYIERTYSTYGVSDRNYTIKR
ncbi:NRDE family protein [Cytobacillus suaedae]|nr:NRDE family protein [Cytobacillus suaedae]